MPEAINYSIPTLAEIKDKSAGDEKPLHTSAKYRDENKEAGDISNGDARLLGTKLEDLQTTGQRVDYLSKAQEEALNEYISALKTRANSVRTTAEQQGLSILTKPESEQLDALVRNAINPESTFILRTRIEELEGKVEELRAEAERKIKAKEEQDRLDAQAEVLKQRELILKQSEAAPVLTGIEADTVKTTDDAEAVPNVEIPVRFDFSHIKKGEDYVAEILTVIKKMSGVDLRSVLDTIGRNGEIFDGKELGIKLPDKLTVDDERRIPEEVTGAGGWPVMENGKRKMKDVIRVVSLPDSMSPRYNFVANVATELWLRRATEVMKPEQRSSLHGLDSLNLDKAGETAQYQKLEALADILFSGGSVELMDKVRLAMRQKVHLEPGKPDSDTITNNMRIVKDIIADPSSYMNENTVIRFLGTSKDRVQMILSSLEDAFKQPNSAMKMDLSIAGRPGKDGVFNLEHFGSNKQSWIEKMKKFAELDKKFDAVTV